MAVGLSPVPHSDHVLHQEEHWYAVYIQPHWESTAQLRLRAQNFRTFLPLHSKTVHHARKRQTILAPLFPAISLLCLTSSAIDGGPSTARVGLPHSSCVRGCRHPSEAG